MTIRAIFTGRVLARISILPKYPGFGCLHCAGWSLCDIHEICYREQCRRLLMLSNRSHAYLGVFLIGAQQHFKSQTYEQTRVHIASLWTFSVDLTFSVLWLVDYVQYLHVIGQTTLDVLGNIKILARTCPVWTAHVATLLILSKAAFMLSKIQ